MKFKNYITEGIEGTEDFTDEYFTKEDIIEMLDALEFDEIQEIGEEIMEILSGDEDFDDLDYEEIEEKQYFAKKKNQVNREKKVDKATKRKLAKKRKQLYKRNKAKIKRQQKLYRKKAKRQPNRVKTHR